MSCVYCKDCKYWGIEYEADSMGRKDCSCPSDKMIIVGDARLNTSPDFCCICGDDGSAERAEKVIQTMVDSGELSFVGLDSMAFDWGGSLYNVGSPDDPLKMLIRISKIKLE